MSAKPSVREKFSLEFVSADKEAAALKALFESARELPDLVLFDPEAVESRESFIPEPAQEEESQPDPVQELRMLFGSVER